MPRNYVDNAMNRRLGRVGMPVGSMPVSSSGGYSGGFSSQKTYVDNSYNRSLGRVGMPHGSMVVSRSGSDYGDSLSSTKTYVDNAYNRSLGRVGMPHGSMVVSRSGSDYGDSLSSTKTYVDNAYNRSLGRVGMPHGSMVVSRSGSDYGDSLSSTKTYVDNAYNRSLGRVGMPHGSMVVDKSISRESYVDNHYNRKLERVGLPRGSKVVSDDHRRKPSSEAITKGDTVYKDNYSNRKLDRVGLPRGSAVCSASGKSGTSTKTYADSPLNRYLGRVGLPRGSKPVSRMSGQTNAARNIFQTIRDKPFDEIDFDSYDMDEMQTNAAHDEALSLINRMEEVLQWQKETKTAKPPRSSRQVIDEYRGKITDFDELKLQRKIGSGGFGDVYFAKWKSSVVAAKMFRVQRISKRRLREFRKEIKLLCGVDHLNIVAFIGACVVSPNLCIVMEYMQMSLFEALHMKDDIEFSEEEKILLIQQIACGLDYLHSSNIAHCDMKSQNVLLDYQEDGSIIAKITDFGLSVIKNETETTCTDVVRNIGTPRYSAPEILQGEFLQLGGLKMADVYSFSLIVFEIVTEGEPFYNLNYSQLVVHVGDRGMTPYIPKDLALDSAVERLMKRCWIREPSSRPSALEVMAETCRLERLYKTTSV